MSDTRKDLDLALAGIRDCAAQASVDVLLQRIVTEVMRFCDATGAVVERLEGDDMVYGNAVGTIERFNGLRVPVRGSLAGICLQTREIQRCVDSENDPRVNREACRKVRARSMLIVPLQFHGEVIGVLKATAERIFAFGPVDEELLRACAAIMGPMLGEAIEREGR